MNRLLDELLAAYDRRQGRTLEAASAPRVRRGSSRVATLAVAVALVVAASAAAGILIATRSAPLSGPLPRQLLGSRYTLRVAPDLRAGRAGWCVSLVDLRTQESVLPNPSDCVSSTDRALISRGGIEVLSPQTGAVEGWLLYAIVDRRVAALQAPNGALIGPISSAALPARWRAAVTIQTNPRAADRASVATLTPVGAQGQRLPTRPAQESAVGTIAANPSDPPRTGCRIGVKPQSGLRVLNARAVRHVTEEMIPQADGPLSCYSLTFTLDGAAGTAALLLDPQRSARAEPPIPGAKPLPGNPEVWAQVPGVADNPADGSEQRLLAEWVGGGWLVVSGSANTRTLLELLAHLAPRT